MLKYKQGFSLIELSIVLIIISLLVAGIMGGKSLIDTAKERAFIRELFNYQQAVNIFKEERGRFPGDIDNLGWFGSCTANDHKAYCDSSYTYSTSDFPSPYNTSSTTPNLYSAPFVELYLAKIIDFEPEPQSADNYNDSNPPSVICKNGRFYFLTQSANNTIVAVLRQYPGATSIAITHCLSYKQSAKIDQKIDDGKYNKGAFRSFIENGVDPYISITSGITLENHYKIF